MEQIWNTILDFLKSMGFAQIFVGIPVCSIICISESNSASIRA